MKNGTLLRRHMRHTHMDRRGETSKKVFGSSLDPSPLHMGRNLKRGLSHRAWRVDRIMPGADCGSQDLQSTTQTATAQVISSPLHLLPLCRPQNNMAKMTIVHRSSPLGWLATLSLLCGILAMPVDIETECSEGTNAKYSLVFTGKWSQMAFPKQYPMYRPPAQWSHLIGVTHSSDYHIWQSNEFASNGVREFAEKGEAWTLMKEVEAAGERIQSVYGVFSAPAVVGGTGQTSSEFEVYTRHSFLSFIVRIVPSPDWFVGVDSINLCEGGHWRENVSLDLFPFDAGTDSGFTFSSPNFETIPQEKVMQITSSFPSHPANSFYYPRLKHLPPMARVTLTKIKNTPLDCEVSAWSPWGLCRGKCGEPGVKRRTRYIHLHPANNGAACPPLEEEKTCDPDNCV
ncbi:hypothetical protein JZ751_025604 [Albula glossodonta]|uniref:Spondin-2 n=1 Tax=Albula glossodonta TaxID=121402 RepID=A0A8T2NLT2_9TELE|nr:hypothetical protein JZ751_025604 [Albula glossodonta]